MKLLFDQLKEVFRQEDTFGIEQNLNKSTVFNIDNVAEYYFQSKQVEWHMGLDFPMVITPFENTFFEFQMPHMGYFLEGMKFTDSGIRFGALIVRHDMDEGESPKAILECVLFGSKNHDPFFMGGLKLAVDKYGSWMPLPGQDNDKGFQYLLYGEDDKSQLILKDGIDQFMRPIFLAISFLHCKNVTTIEQGAGLNLGKRKRHVPSVKYHVLNIEPMKKVLKTEGKSDEVGLKQALHICRGHFKDYRETGLFGKFHDIYWWDSQVRGRAENGIVLKDYKINQPKQIKQGATNV
jgi:hypothetical protein